nr:hypothetical protein Iba_chr12eCG14140 [Ipomoea batatas]
MMMVVGSSCLATGHQLGRKLVVENTDNNNNDDNGGYMNSRTYDLGNHHCKPWQDFSNDNNGNNGGTPVGPKAGGAC